MQVCIPGILNTSERRAAEKLEIQALERADGQKAKKNAVSRLKSAFEDDRTVFHDLRASSTTFTGRRWWWYRIKGKVLGERCSVLGARSTRKRVRVVADSPAPSTIVCRPHRHFRRRSPFQLATMISLRIYPPFKLDLDTS